MAKGNRTLFIVESPNKCKSIKEILTEQCGYDPSSTIVMASMGHFVELADDRKSYHNTGVYPDDDFRMNLKVSSGKQDTVKQLKEQVKYADKVYLFTDGDYEGESISWELRKFLSIPKDKYKRIVTHAITKTDIMKALKNAGDIDQNAVDAAQVRQILDKMIGYRLSSIARKNTGGKSVGRCQSPGLKLIVQREEEIMNFKPVQYHEVFVTFTKGVSDFKAKYVGTDETPVKSFDTKEKANAIVDACKGNDFIVKSVDHKIKYQNNKVPFNTSTFQQEVASKLGYGVKESMTACQHLFEGIEIGGKHVPLITYLRTDSCDYAPEFLPVLEAFIRKKFGDKYYAPVRKAKKSENEQAGHEAIRVIDLEMTPEKLSSLISDQRLIKVYTIIYNRTLASAMANAEVSETTYNIYNKENKFTLVSNEIVFDGFLKVYSYKDDKDDEAPIKETFSKDEKLQNTEVGIDSKETRPPARYKQGTFIKELDKRGIGRPSTYQSIVTVLLDPGRGYCEEKDKCFVPTELGIRTSHFLDKSFSNLVGIDYTAEMEKDRDLIAQGKLDRNTFLKEFHTKLEESVKHVVPEEKKNEVTDEVCPECGSKLRIINGKFGKFYGCTGYPKCKYTKKIQ